MQQNGIKSLERVSGKKKTDCGGVHWVKLAGSVDSAVPPPCPRSSRAKPNNKSTENASRSTTINPVQSVPRCTKNTGSASMPSTTGTINTCTTITGWCCLRNHAGRWRATFRIAWRRMAIVVRSARLCSRDSTNASRRTPQTPMMGTKTTSANTIAKHWFQL